MSKINSDDYERVLFKHDFQYDLILKCLELVENYIRENKLILVGGMAIDYALQTKGKKLYSDDKLPDYDFYSTNFHLDAYKIGELIAKNTSGVSVIRGLHASTMRVRVNFVPVADVTYMPKAIFDTIPTFLYNGLTIAHPFFLMIDQHRALSLPFENPPKETILGRWKKDMTRFDIMQAEFKLGSDCKLKSNKQNTYKIEQKTDFKQIIIDKKSLLACCLGGYVGLLYWANKAVNDGILDKKECKKLGDISINDDNIKVSIPDDMYITIISDDFEKTLDRINKNDKNSEVVYFNAITDKIPRRIQKGDYEVIDNKGRLLAAYIDGKYTISCLQDILNYLLTWTVMTRERRSCIYAYTIGVKVLNLAAMQAIKKDSFNIYLPNVNNIFGDYNWSESYILQLEDVVNALNPSKKTTLQKTPKNAYFDNGKKITAEHLTFDISNSPIYNYDGSICEPFEARELP